MVKIRYCAFCGKKASSMDRELCNEHAVWMKKLLRDFREGKQKNNNL